ncbi:phosphatase PAP2 family protein [Actinomyces sp. oral taxon 897]|uniref:phosphatase PAP2 family protein n=1 Tax=Actinomyces sp. oral taxon 897 TaxID=2081702 RepID=UPI00101ADFB4|nr:phosphatase PAP2 family protein [Actinomyces sp. oral taxon 897]
MAGQPGSHGQLGPGQAERDGTGRAHDAAGTPGPAFNGVPAAGRSDEQVAGGWRVGRTTWAGRARGWGLALLATWVVFVLTRPGQLAGGLVMGATLSSPDWLGTAAARVMEVLVPAPVAACAAGCLLVGVVVAAVRRRWSVLPGVVVLLCVPIAVTEVLVHLLPRPAYGVYPSSNSMPSGHATVAASLVLAWALVLPRWRWLRVAETAVLAGAAGAVVVSRAHVLPDVVAALCVCGLVEALLGRAVRPDGAGLGQPGQPGQAGALASQAAAGPRTRAAASTGFQASQAAASTGSQASQAAASTGSQETRQPRNQAAPPRPGLPRLSGNQTPPRPVRLPWRPAALGRLRAWAYAVAVLALGAPLLSTSLLSVPAPGPLVSLGCAGAGLVVVSALLVLDLPGLGVPAPRPPNPRDAS